MYYEIRSRHNQGKNNGNDDGNNTWSKEKSKKNNNNKKKGKRKATTTTAVVNEAPIDKKQKVSRSEKGTGTIASVDSDPFGTSSSASSSSSALSEHSSDDDDPMSDADNILFQPLDV